MPVLYPFVRNLELGRPGPAIDADLDEVQAEEIDRTSKGLDNEDQQARYDNLKDARGSLN